MSSRAAASASGSVSRRIGTKRRSPSRLSRWRPKVRSTLRPSLCLDDFYRILRARLGAGDRLRFKRLWHIYERRRDETAIVKLIDLGRFAQTAGVALATLAMQLDLDGHAAPMLF